MARKGFLKDKCGPRAKTFEHHCCRAIQTRFNIFQHFQADSNIVKLLKRLGNFCFFLHTFVMTKHIRFYISSFTILLKLSAKQELCNSSLWYDLIWKLDPCQRTKKRRRASQELVWGFFCCYSGYLDSSALTLALLR